jgi:hypothetical protein
MKRPSERLGVDGRILKSLTLVHKYWLDLCGSGQGPVEDSCEMATNICIP